jgi:hypothetical protein
LPAAALPAAALPAFDSRVPGQPSYNNWTHIPRHNTMHACIYTCIQCNARHPLRQHLQHNSLMQQPCLAPKAPPPCISWSFAASHLQGPLPLPQSSSPLLLLQPRSQPQHRPDPLLLDLTGRLQQHPLGPQQPLQQLPLQHPQQPVPWFLGCSVHPLAVCLSRCEVVCLEAFAWLLL